MQNSTAARSPTVAVALPSFAAITAPGEWPRAVSDLPIFLTQKQLAHLRGVTVRTLQRERKQGQSIPFRKFGKKVLYARDDVIAFSTDSSSPIRTARAA